MFLAGKVYFVQYSQCPLFDDSDALESTFHCLSGKDASSSFDVK